MAQSFQVSPEYVDEITFTTKVSNQIQVSINIVGIRYRTSTTLNPSLYNGENEVGPDSRHTCAILYLHCQKKC